MPTWKVFIFSFFFLMQLISSYFSWFTKFHSNVFLGCSTWIVSSSHQISFHSPEKWVKQWSVLGFLLLAHLATFNQVQSQIWKTFVENFATLKFFHAWWCMNGHTTHCQMDQHDWLHRSIHMLLKWIKKNSNKSNLYSAIRHQRYPHSAVHSHNVHVYKCNMCTYEIAWNNHIHTYIHVYI